MFDKKKKGEMDPMEKEARMTAIKAMRKMAEDEMAGKLKKVTVASDSPKGLEEGLAKAKELVANHDEEDSGDDETLAGAEEEQDVENEDHGGASGASNSEYDNCTEAELDQKLKDLMKVKARKQVKSLV